MHSSLLLLGAGGRLSLDLCLYKSSEGDESSWSCTAKVQEEMYVMIEKCYDEQWVEWLLRVPRFSKAYREKVSTNHPEDITRKFYLTVMLVLTGSNAPCYFFLCSPTLVG